ncbi:MAG: protein kinase [Kofleriaceae bacterium]
MVSDGAAATCPGDTLFARFIDGELSEQERRSFEQHYDQCGACRHAVAGLAFGSRSDVHRTEPTLHVEPPPAIGMVIDDKYRLVRELGRGGMGVVFAAEQLALHRMVAIKFMLAATSEGERRFIREARAAATLRSDHVARVLDVVTPANRRPYLVIEYLEGVSVADALRARGPLPIREAVTIALQALTALAEAHARGIVHRDIKPANLFLVEGAGRPPLIKLLDFGLAKWHEADASQLELTHSRALLGSPLYIPPEQAAHARSVDARADVWSLGAVTYHMLAGRAPFAGDTIVEVLTAILHGASPPSLRTIRKDVPAGLDAAVLRCLERDRDRRFSSAAALARAIAPFGGTDAAALVELAASHGEAAVASRSRSSRWISFAAVAAVAGVAIAGYRMTSSEGASSVDSPAVSAPAASPTSSATPAASSVAPIPSGESRPETASPLPARDPAASKPPTAPKPRRARVSRPASNQPAAHQPAESPPPATGSPPAGAPPAEPAAPPATSKINPLEDRT